MPSDTQKSKNPSQVVTSSLIALCVKAASAGLGFVMFASLARAMTLEAYGGFAAIFSLAVITAAVGSFGQKANVVRFAATYDETLDDNLRRGVIRFGYKAVLAVSFPAGCLSAIFSVYFLGLPQAPLTLALVVVLTLAMSISDFQTCAVRVNSGPVLSLGPRDILWRILVICLSLLLPLHVENTENRPELWLGIVAITLILIVVIQFSAYHQLRPAKTFFGPVQMKTRFWARQSLAPWASNLIVTSANNLGVIVIGAAVSVEQAAPYFAALRISQLLNLFLVASEVVLSPMISRAIASRDWAAIQHSCTVNAVLAGGFSCLGVIFLIAFGKSILGVFGAGFESAYEELIVMSLGFMFNSLAGPTVPLLQMHGHSGKLANFQFIANSLSVFLMLLFIPFYGPMAAAVCVALSQAAWNVMSWLYARKTLGIDPSVYSLLSKPKTLGSRG